VSTLAAYATTGNTGESVVLWVSAVIAVCGALGMLLSRKAVHSALFLATTMISLAILYVSQQAPFLGVIQVIVYTGAIMMLFLFVLMMVGVDASDSLLESLRGQRLAAGLFGVALVVLLIAAVGSAVVSAPVGLDDANAADGGNVQGIARLIFGRYLLAFEATSALLITAALGAMVLAFRERYRPRLTQEQLSRQRFRDGGQLTPLPGPGVYARHNAVGTPGLLPDGTTAPLSVPAPLRGRGIIVRPDAEDLRQVRDLEVGSPVVDGEPMVTGADPQVSGPTGSTEDLDGGELR
jgi:NADH-quinone oxidoreductase subunit J